MDVNGFEKDSNNNVSGSLWISMVLAIRMSSFIHIAYLDGNTMLIKPSCLHNPKNM